jgi:hypothetical protein
MRAQKPSAAQQIMMLIALWAASCLVASALVFTYIE